MSFRRLLLIACSASIILQTPVLAQSACDQVLVDEGDSAYQRCIRDEKEDRARKLVDIYRMQVDSQRKSREFFYDQRRKQAELLWKQAEFDIERQKSAAEQQIAYLKIGNADDPQIQYYELQIDALDQKRDLLNRYKDRTIDLYNDRERMELTYLEVQFHRYELSVRGYPILSFDW